MNGSISPKPELLLRGMGGSATEDDDDAAEGDGDMGVTLPQGGSHWRVGNATAGKDVSPKRP